MYYFIYGILYCVSLLPIQILYLLSDLAYVGIYHIAGYRKSVVRQNLLIAFPEKTTAERKRIEKRFYKNFIDNFIETLKLLSGGSRFAAKHFRADPALMQQLYTQGRSCQFYLGHNFNWELANIAVSAYSSHTKLMVYLPVKNQMFDRIMLQLRSSSGNKLLPATDMRAAMMPYRRHIYLLALIADQAPGNPNKAYWLNFFGQPTPFVRGPETGATTANLAVLFAQIYKTRRGHYELKYELCTENATTLPKGELTRRYVRYLEKVIREHPEMWLWSHRRWKRDWNDAEDATWIDESPPPPKGESGESR